MGEDTAKRAFDSELRTRFNPVLRTLGFKGSGRNFLRVRGETINAINIQGSRHGGSVAVNLGLHFAFLPPLWTDTPKSANTFKEIDCDLRTRLTPKPGYDYWWEYGQDEADAAAAATSVVNTFVKFGETTFERFNTPERVLDAVGIELLTASTLTEFPWNSTKPRLALTLARICNHLGKDQQRVAYAQIGLTKLGRATGLRAYLEQLANAS